MVELLYTLFNIECYWRISLKVYIVCFDGKPISAHKSIDHAHNWVINQEYYGDTLEQSDFDSSVFFDDEYLRVYINYPYMYQGCYKSLTIRILDIED